MKEMEAMLEPSARDNNRHASPSCYISQWFDQFNSLLLLYFCLAIPLVLMAALLIGAQQVEITKLAAAQQSASRLQPLRQLQRCMTTEQGRLALLPRDSAKGARSCSDELLKRLARQGGGEEELHAQVEALQRDWRRFMQIRPPSSPALPLETSPQGVMQRLLEEVGPLWHDFDAAIAQQRQQLSERSRQLNFERGLLMLMTVSGLIFSFLFAQIIRRHIVHYEARRNLAMHFSALFDATPEAVLVIDLETLQIVNANHAALTLYGYGRAELLSMRAVELSAEPEQTLALLSQPVLERRTCHCLHRRRDSTLIEVEIYNNQLVSDNRSLLITNIRDVTSRRQMERALRQSEAHFRTLFEAIPDAIFVIDPNSGEIIDLNHKAVELYGGSREELLAKRWSDLCENLEVISRSQGEYHTGAECYIPRTLQRRLVGEAFNAEVFSQMLTLGERAVRLTAVRDITARIQLEAEHMQRQKLETVGQLTGGIAHDFNNLLTVIGGNLELLVMGDELQGNGSQALVSDALAGVDRATQLTQKLLSFSRKQRLNPRPVDLDKLIHDLKLLASRAIMDEMLLAIDSAGPLWVEVDPFQLENAILNLLMNARQAMPQGGTIQIRLASIDSAHTPLETINPLAPGRYAAIAVIDTGNGMSEEVRQRCLEPFFTTKPEGVGTGLGLSTVYGLIRQSGGDMQIHSQLGQGSEITLLLPEIDPQRSATSVSSDKGVEEERGLPRGTAHILVVEDRSDVAQLLANTLIGLGYHVSLISNADEAMARFEQWQGVDLVYCDVVMPGSANGLDLVRWIRQRDRCLPIIVSTGYSTFALDEIKRDATITLLPKPFTLRNLAQLVQAALK